MCTYRRRLHLFILLLMLVAGVLARWLHPIPVAGQALPPQTQEPTMTASDSAQTSQPAAVPGPFVFGAAVAEPDGARVDRMGFNWMLVYDPPNQRQPVNVLYRVPVNHWSYDPDDYYSRWQFQYKMYRLASEQGDWIDAYEIGNEVNLYINGWEAPPNPITYVKLLCTAYEVIKSIDPTAIVVSAGLAPVGRVHGDWNGFTGHNYLTQDEREYFRAFLNAGGANCADVFGYHPLGFSATFDAEPDVDGGTPESNCANGFCFRGVEKFWEITAEFGETGKPVWATEVGWLVEPDDPACLDDYSWAGHSWQRVSPEKQAENLVGAFTYVHEHLPWLGGIFVFNLNFQDAPYYHSCEQMRYYSLQAGSEIALRAMIHELFDFIYLPLIAHQDPFADECLSGDTIGTTPVNNGNLARLRESLAIWCEQKNLHQDSYQYTSDTLSFTGFRAMTMLTVRNGIVVERAYESFTRNDNNNEELYDSWIETEAELGSHQGGAAVRTIDELYNECAVTVLPQSSAGNMIFLSFDDTGILRSCLYVPNNCADDCARGVSIDSITFSDTKVYGALP